MINNDRINIGGVFFDNLTLEEACEKVEKRIKEYKKDESTGFLFVANQDIINKIRVVKGLSCDYVNNAFLTIPDGYSIIAASKILGKPMKERVTGPDLMLKFMEISAKKGYKHFFLGAREGVAHKMADIFKVKFPGIKISGIYSPPFGEFSKKENNKMISMINKSKTDVLWVSFGCPKQEKWILDHLNDLKIPVSAGVGAAFDFHSGNINRAPVIFQKLRLEWFYRFLQEPGRLWKRYFLGGFSFLNIIIKQKKNN